MKTLELLAPARNAEVAVAAIAHGADAVYIGPEGFGARAAAANSAADIARVADYAHRFGARVYATVNTLVFPDELRSVERMVWRLYRAGVDALIVQDMALLRLDLPPVALHASTQCDIRTPEKARFLADVGFSQLVLPREMSVDEIEAVARAVPDTPLEAFIHGALCVSYSGDCQASLLTTGRSANRGECAQICRWPFDLIDGDGHTVVAGRHLLSLRDLNLTPALPRMVEAGVRSFKIEGRLKDAAYVKNVVSHYSMLLDAIVVRRPGELRRLSYGAVERTFTPDPAKSFNRGFTRYFSAGRPSADTDMASVLTPKSQGEEVGTVVSTGPRGIRARLNVRLNNGDGLVYFTPEGTLDGFRLNRIDGGTTLVAAQRVDVAPGTRLYRNHDRVFEQALEGDTAVRTIPLTMHLRTLPWGVALDVADCRGLRASASVAVENQQARSPQADAQRRVMERLGGSCYSLEGFTTDAAALFVPASVLTALRRAAISALETAVAAASRRDLRRPERTDARFPASAPLTYHDNVANPLARQFYADHGATLGAPAAETALPDVASQPRVMTTRYCLRRQLGACLRTPQGSSLSGPLTLVHGTTRLACRFDCDTCRMHLHLLSR